eukprot:4081072-Amphidinium_carterae.1
MSGSDVIKVLNLMASATFSTKTTERLHASAATVRRFHAHTVDILCSRAFLHSIRSVKTSLKRPLPPLLPSTGGQESVVRHAQQRIHRLQHRMVEKVRGRQVFLAESIQQAKKPRGVEVLPRSTMIYAMKEHGRKWDALQACEREYYENLAEARRHQLSQHIREELEREREALRLHLSSELLPDEAGACMSSCRLDTSALEALATLWEANTLTGKNVAVLRKSACTTPEPTSSETLEALQQGGGLDVSPAVDTAAWIKELCRRREGAATSIILRRTEDSEWICARVVLLSKSPLRAVFLHLVLDESPEQVSFPSTLAELRVCVDLPPEIQFSYEAMVFSGGELFGDCALTQLYIYPTSAFHSSTHIVPTSELQMLQHWVAGW